MKHTRISRRVSALGLVVLGGCTVDLNVGFTPDRAVPDAGVSLLSDAGSRPADAGTIDAGEVDAGTLDGGTIDAGSTFVPMTFTFGPSPAVMCTDGLAGREAEVTVTAEDVGLITGVIDVDRTAPTIVFSGAPVVSAFETSRLVLRENVYPEQPEGTFVVAVRRDLPGPIGTRLGVAAIFVDTTSTPMMGQVGFDFAHTGGDGSCFVSFPYELRDP